MTNSERLRKLKEEEREEKSSLSSNSSRLKQLFVQNEVEDISNRINNTYSGWQDTYTMTKNKSAINKAQNRLSSFLNETSDMPSEYKQEYQSLLNSYDNAMSNWDNLSSLYGSYKNKEAFDKEKKTQDLTRKYKGKSYDDIQKALKTATDPDEKNFLSSYTDYDTYDDIKKAMDEEQKSIDAVKGNGKAKSTKMQKLEQRLKDNPMLEYSQYKNNKDYNDVINMSDEDFQKMLEADRESRMQVQVPTYSNTNSAGGANFISPDFISNLINKATAPKSLPYSLNGEPSYDELPDEMKDMGKYVYRTQGEKAYKEFKKKISDQVTKQTNDEMIEGALELADEHPYLMGAVSPVMDAALSLPTVAETVMGGITGNYNQYSGASGLSRVNRAVNSHLGTKFGDDLADFIDNKLGGTAFSDIAGNVAGEAAKVGYMAYSSGVVSRALQGFFGDSVNLILGAASFAPTYTEALENGHTQGQAIAKGLASAVIEYATEHFGMEWAFGEGATALDTIKKQFLAEGSEELVGNILDFAADKIIHSVIDPEQSQTDFQKEVMDYVRRGMTLEEARFEAAKSFIKETAEAFVSAGLSAGLTAGTQNALITSSGKNINSEGLAQAMGMLDQESDTAKKYNDLVEKYGGASNIPNWNKAMLYSEAYDQALKDTYENFKATGENSTDYQNASMTLNALNEAYRPDLRKTNNKEGIKSPTDKPVAEQTVNGKTITNEEYKNNLEYINAKANTFTNEGVKNIFTENYMGQEPEKYQTYFEYIKDYADHTSLDPNEMLKHIPSSVMSQSQASSIYEALTRNNGVIATNRTEANNKIYNEWKGTYSKKGTFDDSSIDYNTLSKSQKNFVGMMKIFSEMGMNIRVFKDSSSLSDNGSYENGAVNINLDAYYNTTGSRSGRYAVNTFAHESTHWIANILGEEFNNYKDLVKNKVGSDKWNELVNLELNRDKSLTEDKAEEEVMARIHEDMFNDNSVMEEILGTVSKDEANSLIKSVNRWYNKISKNIKEWLSVSEANSDAEAARLLRDMEDGFKEVRDAYVEMFKKALAINQQTENLISSDPVNVVNDNTVMLSQKTYENGGKEYMVNYLRDLVKNHQLDKKDADEILNQLDSMYELSKEYSINPNFIDYRDWQKTDALTDVFGKSITTIVTNGDYPFNIDMSTVCKKRKALDKVLNTLAKEGDFDDYLPTGEAITELQKIIKENGFEIACGLCFVDAKRYRVGQWANSYLYGYTGTSGSGKGVKHYGYNEIVMQMAKLEKTKADYFRFLDTDKFLINAKGDLHTKNLTADSPSMKYLAKIIKESKKGSNNYIIAQALMEKPELRKLLTGNQIISSAGLDNMRVLQPDLFDMVKASSGQATPKLSLTEVPFTNEVLKEAGEKPKNIEAMREKLRRVGGYRVQSFSDYMANMVFDYVQLISNFSAVKYPSHAYTKEYYFVKLFGLTGMKINMSIVPAATSSDIKDRFKDVDESKLGQKKYNDIRDEYLYYKAHAGLEKATKDNYDYYDEEDKTYWKYILEDECFPIDKTNEILTDARYSKNCGTIWVGVSNKHIKALLNDPMVSQVIPYHKSNINPIVAHLRNVWMYNDYEDYQSEKLNGKSLKAKKFEAITGYNFYDSLDRCEKKWNKMSAEDKAKRSVPQMAADEYLAVCRKHKITPKFEGVILDGHDITEEPNYYKVLADFSLIDSEGNYARQNAVSMTFPEDFGELMEKSLSDAQKVSNDLSEKQDKILKEARKVINADKKRSAKVDSEGKELTNNQQKFFENSVVRDALGRLKVMYHGTKNGGFTVFKYAKDGISFFFTDNKKVAPLYSTTEFIQNPDEPLSYEDLANAYEDMADGILEKNEDGTYTYEAKTFKDIKEAQEYLVDNYLSLAAEQNNSTPTNYAVYLNVENPLIVNAKGSPWNAIKRDDYDKHFENIEIKKQEDGTYYVNYKEVFDWRTPSKQHWGEVMTEKELHDVFGYGIEESDNTLYAPISTLYLDSKGHRLPSTTEDYSKYAKENGYDGVIFNDIVDSGFIDVPDYKSQVVVVFDSNQVKSIYNENPTKDKDIRHSRKVGDQEMVDVELPASNGKVSTYTITKKFADVLNKLDNHVWIDDFNELKAVPEIEEALERLEDSTETINLPNREEKRKEWISQLLSNKGFADSKDMVYNEDARKDFKAYIVIGLPASGKSSVITNKLLKQHRAFLLDNDEAKKVIPEYAGGNGASIVHEESKVIADEVAKSIFATNEGINLVMPIIGSESKKLLNRIKTLQNKGYNVELHLVEIDKTTSLGRLLKRFIADKRFINPQATSYKYGNKPSTAFEEVKGEANGYAKWNNEVKFGEQAILTESKGTEGLGEVRTDIRERREDRGRVLGSDVSRLTENKGTERSFSKKVESETYRLLNQQERAAEEDKKFQSDIKRLGKLLDLQKKTGRKMIFSTNRLGIIADRIFRNIQYNNQLDPEFKDDFVMNLGSLYSEITQYFSDYEDAINTEQNIMDACLFLASKITEPIRPIFTSDDLNAKYVFDEFTRFERTKEIAREIYNGYWTVSSMNVADAIKKSAYNISDDVKRDNIFRVVQVLEKDHREAMADLKKSKEEAIAEVKREQKELVKKIRQENDQKMKDYREAVKERNKEKVLNAEKRAYVERITNTAMTLMSWLRKNDTKNMKYIPDGLKVPVFNLLNSIDYSSKQLLGMTNGKYSGMSTKKDRAIVTALNDIKDYLYKSKFKEMTDDTYSENYMDIHASTVAEIEELVKRLSDIADNNDGYVLNQMEIEDLENLSTIMTVLKTSITNINERIGNQGKGKISDAAVPDIIDNKELGAKQNSKFTKDIKAFFEWGNTLPQYAFEHLGKGASDMFRELKDGWNKFAFEVQSIKDFAQETWTGKEYKEWSETIHEYTIKGTTFQMTDTQRMSLYCLAKREQALKHLYEGGMTVEPFEKKNGKYTDRVTDIGSMTKKDIEMIAGESTFTDRQLEVAKALQNFMNTTCSDWMNEVTMKRWGIRGATEENYFPITVDETTTTDDGTPKDMVKSIFKLLNMGFTKALNEKASNPIDIQDIFDVFISHSTDMAKYNSLALPVLDMYRYYNFKEKGENGDILNMKSSIKTAYGTDAMKYITTFLLDLNANREDTRGGKWFKLAKGYKVAAVAGNLQVAALQPVAIVRAKLYLSNASLLRGATHIKSGIDEMLKYSGIAVWKDMSLFDTNVARGIDSQIKQNESKKDKFVEATMKLAEWGDKITWGTIWSACKDEQMRNGLRGDELIQATKEQFEDVIYHTQVVDSTMTRSEIMRGSTPFAQMLTSFMSEPTIAMNLLQDAGVRFFQDARRYGKKEAFKRNGKNIGRCCYIYTLTAGVEAILRGLMGKYRDWDEESDEMLENMWKEFIQNVIPLGNIPVGRDIMSLLQGYSVDRMDMASAQSIIRAGASIAKVVKGDKEMDYKTIYRSMQAISQMTGIPLSSLMRDGFALWNDTIGEMYPSLKVK